MAVLKLKNRGSCVKKGIAKLGQVKNEDGTLDSIYIAVTTRGAGDNTVFKCIENMQKTFAGEKCKKSRIGTKEEKEAFLKENQAYDPNIMLKIVEYDTTSLEHTENLFNMQSLIKFMNIVNSMDFERDINEGKNYWEDLEIEVGNYTKVAEYIRDVIKPSEQDLALFNEELKALESGKPTIAETEIRLIEKNGKQ